MKTLFQLVIALLLCSTISAQSVITRISAGEDFYYYANELQTALNDASPGDTILLPGQQYDITANINTSVVLIGVGYVPTESAATGITFINGGLTINAPNTEVIGMKILSTITVQATATGSVLQRIKGEGNVNFNGNAHDIMVTECVFANPSLSGSTNGTVAISNADNIEINNSLIEILTTASGSTGCIFNNNIIFDGLTGVSNATFNCNIIDGGFAVGSTNTTENDNIFNNTVVLDPGCTDACLTTDIGSDNVSINTIFVTATSVFGFDLPDYPELGGVFFLFYTSPAFTHCPTDDQVGVYGGPQPFKIGAVPPNPHITSKSISGVSTTDQINVVVGVEAQDN